MFNLSAPGRQKTKVSKKKETYSTHQFSINHNKQFRNETEINIRQIIYSQKKIEKLLTPRSKYGKH